MKKPRKSAPATKTPAKAHGPRNLLRTLDATAPPRPTAHGTPGQVWRFEHPRKPGVIERVVLDAVTPILVDVLGRVPQVPVPVDETVGPAQWWLVRHPSNPKRWNVVSFSAQPRRTTAKALMARPGRGILPEPAPLPPPAALPAALPLPPFSPQIGCTPTGRRCVTTTGLPGQVWICDHPAKPGQQEEVCFSSDTTDGADGPDAIELPLNFLCTCCDGQRGQVWICRHPEDSSRIEPVCFST